MSAHETWCDTQNKISERCNCIVSSYIEQIEDLQAKLELAVNALEVYAMTNDTFPEYGTVAKETLAKIKVGAE